MCGLKDGIYEGKENMKKLVSMERVYLRNSKDINEKMIQEYIYDNPSCLGLGDLTALTKEKSQPSGGRLDILMADDDNTRYEIEIQLGETDPSHIIRTIEYWDTERKRYQKYDHVAVIVAEQITGRLMNVIQLFNGNIPIIALQLAAYKMSDGEIALVFTKVLDRITPGDDEDDDIEPTDRNYWLNKSTPERVKIVDEICANCAPLSGYEMKYNKFYIGLTKDGITKNPVTFRPRKNYIYVTIYRISDADEYTERLDKTGLSYDYYSKASKLRVRIDSIKDYMKNKELVDSMISQAVEVKG